MPFGGESDAEALSLLNDDTMPSPSEALLAALGSCLSVSIQANAVAQAIPIRRLVIELEGDIDFAALWGTGDLGFKGLGFETIASACRLRPTHPATSSKRCSIMQCDGHPSPTRCIIRSISTSLWPDAGQRLVSCHVGLVTVDLLGRIGEVGKGVHMRPSRKPLTPFKSLDRQ
jgi:hypothetical protein